jgi:murein DD-endopeptidase MepM/ murein hydrolase activator NlpD
MPRSEVESRPRAWPRAVVLALVGITAAGCSDSARFESTSYNTDRPAPPQNVASAIPPPQASGRVETQPLPAPSQPAAVSSAPATYGSQTLGAYRSPNQGSAVTGSVARAPATSGSGHWTWNGGSAVTVGYGETIDTIARQHRVPASALMQTNGIRDASQIRPGQRLVIPRYVSAMSQTAAVHSPAQATAGKTHVVKSGGGHPVVAAQPSPQVAEPRKVPEKTKVASAAPVQSVQVAKEEPRGIETAVKTAEPSGAMPSFRWPVRGRVIAGFGSKNGTQNDGINLAVPEGTPIKAADDGVVAYAGNELKGYGNLVLIRHSNGYVSAYAHASELMVKRGDTIKRGQVIAHAGQTGNVTSPQLHFEIRKGSTPVDPSQYLGGA